MNRLDPETLKRPQVIDISQFIPQFFKNFPVPVASGDSICLMEMLFKVGLHTVVVDERVIDVEKENDTKRL
jgi:hypothetical protein